MCLEKIWRLVASLPIQQAFTENSQGGERVKSDLGKKDEGLGWRLREPFVLGAVLWGHDHSSLSNLLPTEPNPRDKRARLPGSLKLTSRKHVSLPTFPGVPQLVQSLHFICQEVGPTST